MTTVFWVLDIDAVGKYFSDVTGWSPMSFFRIRNLLKWCLNILLECTSKQKRSAILYDYTYISCF